MVRRTFLASGGSAYTGTPAGQAPEGWHAAHGGDIFQNAKAASDAAFTQDRGDQEFNRAAFRRDQPGRAYPPELMTGEETAQRRGAVAEAASFDRSRSKQPIEAGTMATGHRVQIVGPNMVRLISPDGIGSSTFTTAARGKPVDAHSYLMSKPGFTPSDSYKAQRQQGIEAGMAAAGTPITAPEAGVVRPGAGGDYLSKGGVEAPVENLTPQDRLASGAGTLRDTLTASPAAVAVGKFAGRAVDRLAGIGRSIYEGFGGGGSVAAGASRAQAARIQKPTQESPVPTTPTSPEPLPPPPPLEEDARFTYGR